MLRKLMAIALAMAAVALVSSAATAGGLSVGDPAPKLAVKRFVKGAPVTKFEKGKIYVVEFWATWCGPCRESIPHLTEMAKKNKDVTFVGVSVWEQDQSKVAPFVTTMGDKMNYHVAMDAVPVGGDGNSGAMAMTWMKAAEQDGIPSAFIVNKESKVAWIGHPMTMEEPLSKIVAGTWDIKVEAEKSRKAMVAAHKMRDLMAKVNPLYQKKQFAEAVTVLDDAVASDPDIESATASMKLAILQRLGKTEEQAGYITKLVSGAFKDDTQNLNQMAWQIVDPDARQKPTPLLAAAAVKAALRADELTKGKDAAITDTLAAAYFANGDAAKAVQTQERAITLAKGTQFEKDPSFVKHLALYKAGQ
jgi:thiol-disulfide isomerase/thioredoxin